MIEIGLRRARQALQRPEYRAVVPPRVQVKVALDLLGPDGPDTILAIERESWLPDVSAHARNLRPCSPSLLLVVIAGEADLVPVAVEAGPAHPHDRAVSRTRGYVREIVRARVLAEPHRAHDARVQRRLRLRIAGIHEGFGLTQVGDVLPGHLVLGRGIRSQAARLGVVRLAEGRRQSAKADAAEERGGAAGAMQKGTRQVMSEDHGTEGYVVGGAGKPARGGRQDSIGSVASSRHARQISRMSQNEGRRGPDGVRRMQLSHAY